MREILTTALEAIGVLFVSIGSFQIAPALGFIVTGALLITAGIMSA